MGIFTSQEVVDKPKMTVINQNKIKTKVIAIVRSNLNGCNYHIRVFY